MAPNIIELARQAGLSNYKAPGGVWMPELEVMHILACLKRIHYDDNKDVRTRRHLLIMGPKGACKSSMSKRFLLDLAGSVDYNDVDPGYRSKPTISRLDGGGVSWEKQRGGSVEGAMVMPTLHDVTYIASFELFSFLGDERKNKMEVLNTALEEGDVVVNQLQAAGVPTKKKMEFAEQCASSSVHYNIAKDSFRYKVTASMVACTRFLLPDQFKLLDSSGFLSRFHISEWRPSDEEDDEYQLEKNGPIDTEAEAIISAFNRYAWSCRFASVTLPPREMVREVMVHYNERYREVSRQTETKMSELRSERDQNDVIQLLTAFAVMRVVQERMAAGLPPEVESIQYSAEDVAAVKAFREYHLGMVEERAMRQAKADPMRDQASRVLTAYLRWCEHEGGDYYNFATKELVAFIMETDGCSRPTAYNRIAKMRDCGLLDRVGTQRATATEAAIANAGLVPAHVRDDEMAELKRDMDEEAARAAQA